VLGVAPHNSLVESALFHPQLKKGVGGVGGVGGGVGEKNTPRSRGVMATLPAKALQKYAALVRFWVCLGFLGSYRGAVGLSFGFLGFGCGLGWFRVF
jgi:hypothetical protein